GVRRGGASRKCIDQSGPVRTTPASRQIVAGGCRIAIAAAGDIVEIGVIARAQANRIKTRIDEPNRAVAVSDCLLISEGQVAGPHGGSKTVPTIHVGGAGSLAGADVKGEICVCRNVRAVAISRGT